SIESLSPKPVYYYRIRAESSGGISSNSNVIEVRIPSSVNGLVASYPFNGSANDESGNGFHGTVNGAILTTDRFGNENSAYSFDGVNDNITVGEYARFQGEVSIGVWVLSNTFSGTQKIIDLPQFKFTTFDESLQIDILDNTGSNIHYNNVDLLSGTWIHLFATYDGVTLKTYVNGEEASSEEMNLTLDDVIGTTYIGSSSFPDIYFNGKIDEILIYDRALSASEIASLYTTSELPILDAEILSFSFPNQIASTIDQDTIWVEMPSGTDLTSLIADFALSSGAISRIGGVIQESGSTANNFSQPVKYRITAEDNTRTKDWIIMVTVIGAPEITNVSFPDSYEVGAGGVTVTCAVSSNQNLNAVNFYVKKLIEGSYQSFTMSQIGSDYSFLINDQHFDELGTTFYIKAEDTQNGITHSLDFVISTVFGEQDVESLPDITSSTNALDYSMISMPYERVEVSTLFSNLGEYNNKDWKLAHYNGDITYQFYSNDFTHFEPGKGYWFLTSKSTDFNLKGGSSVHVSEDEPFTIQLRANDWNMIGNPYPFHLDWQEVIDYNSVRGVAIEKLVTFKNRQFNSGQTILNKYDGALLYSSEVQSIEIPISAKLGNGARILSETKESNLNEFGYDEWQLNLSLSNQEMGYHVSGFGMSEDASHGFDIYDRKLLPRLSSYLELIFDGKLSRAIVPLSEQYTWHFSINSNMLGELNTINWENTGISQSDFGLVLLDLNNQRLIDMGKSNSYSFKMDEKSCYFKVFYSPKDQLNAYINFEQDNVGDPYPNPTSGQFNIPISFSNPNTSLKMKVYNILGELVFESSEVKANKGYHNFSFNLNENSAINIQPGTYIISIALSSGDNFISYNKRMVLAK
ncbi:MAG: LamG-like jellyroll fold domain-containing protein, partial [Reichenbachiella sp.]